MLLLQSEFRAGRWKEAAGHCQTYLACLAQLGLPPPHRNLEIASMALSSCYWAALQ